MSFRVYVNKKSVEPINELPEKTRGIIIEALASLEGNPWPGEDGDREKLLLEEGMDVCRLHIGRSYTAFYTIDSGDHLVRVHDVMTIGQAHHKYGRI